MPISIRFSLVVVLLSLASIEIASACSITPRDKEAIDESSSSSVWRKFWSELRDVGDGVGVSSRTTTTLTTATTTTLTSTPRPPVWPDVFHALLVQTRNGTSSLVDLYYDWPRGRNANLIRRQLAEEGETLYDVEHTNGTSFYFTRPSSSSSSPSGEKVKKQTCKTVTFPVGILPPNWLDGARYLGPRKVDGFDCHGMFLFFFIKKEAKKTKKIPSFPHKSSFC